MFTNQAEREHTLRGFWQGAPVTSKCVLFLIAVVLLTSLGLTSSLHAVVVVKSVPNITQTVNCDNFAHRLTICVTCFCMVLVIIGVLVLLFVGKLRPQDIGNWKAGTGLAAVFVFLYEVLKATLGNCNG